MESSQVTLLVSGITFQVDPNLLMSHSSYFQAMFSGRFKESVEEVIKLEDLCAETFSHLLGFLNSFESQENLMSVTRIFQLPQVFLLADMFCMDRLLRFLKKGLKSSWFKVREIQQLLTICEQLGLTDEMVTKITKDFLPHLDPDIGTPKMPVKHFNIKNLSVLLKQETFWSSAFGSTSLNFFSFMEQLLIFVLGQFVFKRPVFDSELTDKQRDLVRKSKVEYLPTETVRRIVRNVGITGDVKKAFWSVHSERIECCRSRIGKLLKQARCILSSHKSPGCIFSTILDVKNWFWTLISSNNTTVSCRQLCYNYHNYSTDFCDPDCEIRNLEKKICNSDVLYSHSYVSCLLVDNQNMWLVAEKSNELQKLLFYYHRETQQLNLLTVLEDLRVIHALENGADGSIYIVAEPSYTYELLSIFRFIESESGLSLLACIHVKSLFVGHNKLTENGRLLRRESRIFLSNNSLHLLLLVPSYHSYDKVQQKFHLFSGIIDTTSRDQQLNLHRVISYHSQLPGESVFRENWCVFRKGNSVVLVLVNDGLFVMRYNITSGYFRHMGFLPNLPSEYQVRNFSPVTWRSESYSC